MKYNPHAAVLLPFLFLIFSYSLAIKYQTLSDFNMVSGYVSDHFGVPVAGAFIRIEDSRQGTLSLKDGSFRLITGGEVAYLTVLAKGYRDEKVLIKEDSIYRIILREGESSLLKESRDVLRRTTRREGIEMKLDFAARAFDADAVSMEISPEGDPGTSVLSGVRVEPRAGMMTAGEWNDLTHYGTWEGLIKGEEYREMHQHWSLHLSERVSVYVSNAYHLPLTDATVQLYRRNELVWEARTDNSGKAELWYEGPLPPDRLVYFYEGQRLEVGRVKTFKEGVNHVIFEVECSFSPAADIVFAVDATGSMGDEIQFLKTELQDVITAVTSSRQQVEFRWGAVFYRDTADDYLTQHFPLDEDEEALKDFIGMQEAGGGGDYPEAVHAGLEDALNQPWRTEALTRIVFLILDAPPHQGSVVSGQLLSQVKRAAEMGIKIIPVTASGIDRATEFLMKWMALHTNGTYVFITDDSGIGKEHLEPVVDSYEVEKLNALLVRLISNYSDPGRCTEWTVENNDVKGSVFPNPASREIEITLPPGTELVLFTSASGKVLQQMPINGESSLQIELEGYVDGLYLVHIKTNQGSFIHKVIKVARV